MLEREYKYYSNLFMCVCDRELLSCLRASILLLSLSTCVYVRAGRRRKRRRRTKRTHELIHPHAGVMVLVEEEDEEEEEVVVVVVVEQRHTKAYVHAHTTIRILTPAGIRK